jgi:hypothetical protein
MFSNSEKSTASERELIEYFRMVNGLDEPLGVSGLLPPAAAERLVEAARACRAMPADQAKRRVCMITRTVNAIKREFPQYFK